MANLVDQRPLRKPQVTLKLQADVQQKVLATVDPLMLTDDQVGKVMARLQQEMWQGMSKDEAERRQSSLQMEVTYVRSLLNGSEDGDYLALDLGGTNFRVLLCRMRQGRCESISKNYNVPTPTLYGPAAGVFDHIAESIFKFLNEEGLSHRRLPLGFTFSFPMVQTGLKKGLLVTWTKSFACPDGVGEDAVKMLEDAIQRRGDFEVEIVAVLNDTTGTLLAGSYLNKRCTIGCILGTGCNAAYVEKLANIAKWKGDDVTGAGDEVVVDTEWGAFGDNGSLDFLKTPFDKVIDLNSNHVGSFTFEKLFAGHYVGDLARLVLLKLAEDGLIFGGTVSEQLRVWGSVTSSHVSDVERDDDTTQRHTRALLDHLNVGPAATDGDVSVVRYLCSALTIRTAQLLGAVISVLLHHTSLTDAVVAMDGSVYRYHPLLRDAIADWLAALAPHTKCELILAEDGSGRGAAFVAAVATRLASAASPSAASTS